MFSNKQDAGIFSLGLIDKHGGEGLKMHYTYICTLSTCTVICTFFWGGGGGGYYSSHVIVGMVE